MLPDKKETEEPQKPNNRNPLGIETNDTDHTYLKGLGTTGITAQ